METVSTRPDMVTGGDALVQIEVPDDINPHDITVHADGRNITDAFLAGDSSNTLLGLVDSLPLGASSIDASTGQAGQSTNLAITNHELAGPVFSGPQQEPFYCTTEAFGLGPPEDEDCYAPTKTTYEYMSTSTDALESLDPDSPLPDDVAETTTTNGTTVPFIVRTETGVINRAIYQVRILHEPGSPLPDPWTATPGWNDRLVYSFGGACEAGHRQGTRIGSNWEVGDEEHLAHGYAVATSSLNVFGNVCNDIISAETLMMVKEHFTETIGQPEHTIAYGCSGGSMQVHLIAQNYPGLLDGIVPACSFPDITTLISSTVDCALIDNAIDQGAQSWTPVERAAVSGFAHDGEADTCGTWNGRASYSPGWIVPDVCPGGIPADAQYSPDENPDGIRCTIHDTTIVAYGSSPLTGFARRPLDNVGVQYGLTAFNQGEITFDQFVELNTLVGGFDIDGRIVSTRTEADSATLRRAYQTGRVNTGSGGLSEIPILDIRGYTDEILDIHDRFRTLSTRARLDATNGHHDNHVAWMAGPEAGINGGLAVEAVLTVDEWLTNMEEDDSPGTKSEKIARNKPADAVDTCWSPTGEKVVEEFVYDGDTQCNDWYPPHGDPRVASGAPLENNVLKCTTTPVSAPAYATTVTSEQLSQLQEVFSEGVCDYSKLGIEQQTVASTWIRYSADGPIAEVTRVAGADRYDTAARVAQQFESGVDSVFLATGGDYPDALTAAARAGSLESPVLLVKGDSIPAVTAAELVRLSPRNVVVVGGNEAVSEAVEIALQNMVPDANLRRFAGASRYDTAALISAELQQSDVAYVASGADYADALAGAARAASIDAPVLLVKPDSVPAATLNELERLDVDRIVLLGGPLAVSDDVEAQLTKFGSVQRIAGADRYETAAKLTDDSGQSLRVYVATGQNWPDALAGAARAGAVDAPILLTKKSALPAVTSAALQSLDPADVFVLGGPEAVDPGVLVTMRAPE